MPSPIYQNMVNLIMGFPNRRRQSIFMDVVMWEHRTFDCEVLNVARFTNIRMSIIITNFV
jgi:hypothetical protein